jgi:hypothetical protein
MGLWLWVGAIRLLGGFLGYSRTSRFLPSELPGDGVHRDPVIVGFKEMAVAVHGDGKGAVVSIGVESGPLIGVQKGPPLDMRSGASRERARRHGAP